MKRTAFVLVFMMVFITVAEAAGYEEFYVKASNGEPAGVELVALLALRKTAFEAAQRRDNDGLQATFADQLTIYTANVDPSDMESDKFRKFEIVTPQNLIRAIGERVKTGKEVTQPQLLRSAIFAIIRLLRDPHIGPNGKMGGMVCNRPVNKPDPVKFKAARVITKSTMADWVVVRQDMGPDDTAETPGQYPTRIFQDQMVLKTKENHGNNQWTSIAAPDGGKSLFYRAANSYDIAPFFASYVAQHVCFGKEKGRWKITAFALRVQ